MRPLKIDITKVLKTNGSSLKVERIADYSRGEGGGGSSAILKPALSDNWYRKPIDGILF